MREGTERCDGTWGTPLFQPNALRLTHISVSTHCSVYVWSLPKSWVAREGHFKVTPAGEEAKGFRDQVCVC